MLELTGIRVAYGTRTVLSIDELRIERASRIAIVGPNGAGKSTLLRLLAFLERPAAGTIALEGKPVRGMLARHRARRRVTLVEQRPFLFRGSVLDNVAWGPLARRASRAAAVTAAREALALLQCGTLAARDARMLSDGEVQRVAVARAVAAGPDVLLLDEPVSGADRAAQQALYTAISALQGQRALTVCVASHQLEDAYRWADRIVALHEGTPVGVSPENLFRVELAGGEGMQTVRLGGVELEVVTDRSGPVTLAIPPDEILLSEAPLHSSARNVLHGHIVRVAEQGAALRVTVDAGIELVALVTRRSYEEMHLLVGAPVYVVFKSVAIRVF